MYVLIYNLPNVKCIFKIKFIIIINKIYVYILHYL